MPQRLASTFIMVWTWFAHASAITLLAGSISAGLLFAFASSGAVLVVTHGPVPASTSIPYKGELVYTFSVKRLASCPGHVVKAIQRLDGTARDTVSWSRPVLSTEIKSTDDVTVRNVLPDSVVPGRYLFISAVQSRCPTYTQVDELARFEIEVTPNDR